MTAPTQRSGRSARPQQAGETLPPDPLWYKDAVIYEVPVRAFFDSDGNGTGDFRGLTQKLAYLRDLGITAIWVLPFYPSPGRDDGYDIVDYVNANSDYGTAADVRALDANHPITAGWLRDEAATLPYVDFVSFHHWDDALRLRLRVAQLASETTKPILLEEVGYSTYRLDEAQQAQFMRDALQAAEFDGVVGWLIWTAFDFPLDATCLPPECPSLDNLEHHFGLWRTDYTPKPALTSVRVLMANAGLRDAPEEGE